jgi:hypothetical protein
MGYTKRAAGMVGTLVAVAMVAALVAPKSVHALVATLVRDVDNPARAPIISANCQSQPVPILNLYIYEPCDLYTVPSGQRLVIEQVETDCETPVGQTVSAATFNLVEGGVTSDHAIALTPQAVPPNGGFSEFVNNQSVRYYADPGSMISFKAYISDQGGSTACWGRLTGYLITYP